MHLDDERIQRLLHGELAPGAAAAAREHVAACAECRVLVADAKREESEVLDLLRELDHSSPRVRVADVMAASRRERRRWGRWAAAAVVTIATASATYALPGSPLPALVSRATSWLGGDGRPATPSPARETEATTAGVALPPGEHLEIAFTALQPEGMAIVSLSDTGMVVVRARGGEPTFNSAVNRLEVGNEGSAATFLIQVPRSAPAVDIVVAGRRVWRKEGTRTVTAAPRDGEGRYLLSLSAGGS